MEIPRLHLVTDDRLLAGPMVPRVARVVEAAGPRVAVHVRGPATPGRRLYEVAAALRPVCRGRGAWLVVNDRPDVAAAVRAEGVHLGRRSVGPACARRIVGPGRVVGCSVHSADEAATVAKAVDLLLVGTLFATPSHPGRPPAGTRLVRDCREGARTVIGIGGITPERVAAVVGAGAHGVAVLRGVWDADDPVAATRDYLERLYHD